MFHFPPSVLSLLQLCHSCAPPGVLGSLSLLHFPCRFYSMALFALYQSALLGMWQIQLFVLSPALLVAVLFVSKTLHCVTYSSRPPISQALIAKHFQLLLQSPGQLPSFRTIQGRNLHMWLKDSQRALGWQCCASTLQMPASPSQCMPRYPYQCLPSCSDIQSNLMHNIACNNSRVELVRQIHVSFLHAYLWMLCKICFADFLNANLSWQTVNWTTDYW